MRQVFVEAGVRLAAELEATMAVLAGQRERALALLKGLPEEVLDHDDPARELPAYPLTTAPVPRSPASTPARRPPIHR